MKLCADVEFLSALLNKKFKVRSSEKAFTVGGQSFEPGTLIVTRRNNEGMADFDTAIKALANDKGRKFIHPLQVLLIKEKTLVRDLLPI
ncbi:MAG: hypothetical protein U5K54_16775 [Cytophagales bacterium]|nr:hypothetical protein [Cytophagales bacterium]